MQLCSWGRGLFKNAPSPTKQFHKYLHISFIKILLFLHFIYFLHPYSFHTVHNLHLIYHKFIVASYLAHIIFFHHLIACHHSTQETAQIIGADTLGYLPVSQLKALAGGGGYCGACFDGAYPTKVPSDTRKNRF